MDRRGFLSLALAQPLLPQAYEGSILVHEHVLADFIGADQVQPGRYDPEEAFRAAKPKLEEVYRLGCRRLQECTPNFLGRDPRLLRRLSDATGLEIWTNTGLYSAANHKFLPGYALQETAGQLAKRWISEVREGVEGVKPRFIKIGVNKGPLDELDRKIVQAAALASKDTGLTVAAHTGDGAAALQEIEIFEKEDADLSKFVWVHAQSERDHALHRRAGEAGAWVEFDGIGEKTAEWHLECVRFMADANVLKRTLISQDSGWYRVGEPGGGDYRGYTFLYTDFLPRLQPEWRMELLRENPLVAFGH